MSCYEFSNVLAGAEGRSQRNDLLEERRALREQTLRGEWVGLEEIDDGVWSLYYGPVLLARFNEREKKLGRGLHAGVHLAINLELKSLISMIVGDLHAPKHDGFTVNVSRSVFILNRDVPLIALLQSCVDRLLKAGTVAVRKVIHRDLFAYPSAYRLNFRGPPGDQFLELLFRCAFGL
jgi:hypothetical protein